MTSVGDHGINKDNQVRKSGNNVSGSYQYGDRKKKQKEQENTTISGHSVPKPRHRQESDHSQLRDSGKYVQDESV